MREESQPISADKSPHPKQDEDIVYSLMETQGSQVEQLDIIQRLREHDLHHDPDHGHHFRRQPDHEPKQN